MGQERLKGLARVRVIWLYGCW